MLRESFRQSQPPWRGIDNGGWKQTEAIVFQEELIMSLKEKYAKSDKVFDI